MAGPAKEMAVVSDLVVGGAKAAERVAERAAVLKGGEAMAMEEMEEKVAPEAAKAAVPEELVVRVGRVERLVARGLLEAWVAWEEEMAAETVVVETAAVSAEASTEAAMAVVGWVAAVKEGAMEVAAMAVVMVGAETVAARVAKETVAVARAAVARAAGKGAAVRVLVRSPSRLQ